jgi:hypothetical protein
MERFTVVTKKVVKMQGKDKNQWNQVGTLVRFPASKDKPEGFALELSMFPDTRFYIFPADESRE